jgi:hypothetical protein
LGKKRTNIGVEIFHGTRSENQIKNKWKTNMFKKFVMKEYGKEMEE